MKLYHFPPKRMTKSEILQTHEMVEVVDVTAAIPTTHFEKRIVNTDEVNKGLKPEDFSIRNILSTGATDLLKENKTITSSPLQVAASVEQFTEN